MSERYFDYESGVYDRDLRTIRRGEVHGSSNSDDPISIRANRNEDAIGPSSNSGSCDSQSQHVTVPMSSNSVRDLGPEAISIVTPAMVAPEVSRTLTSQNSRNRTMQQEYLRQLCIWVLVITVMKATMITIFKIFSYPLSAFSG